ncbi:phosphatidic acid phosphatase type 2/haloperoxidase [Phyllosticta paracitricarpa]
MPAMDAWNNQRLPFSKKRLSKKVIISYILDYVIIVLFVAGFYALDSVEPYHQHFSLQNYTLQYPYAVKERVPVFDLVIIAVLAPAIIIAIYTLVIDGLFSNQPPPQGTSSKRRKLSGKYRMKDRLWELNCGVLGLLLSVGAAFTITGTLKNAVGKPRPDLIDRCQPKPGSHDPPVYGLSNHSICTQTDNAILKDGFRSFPSGHSSTAFGGLFYLTIYLAAKMHVLDSKGEVWKTFIILIPALGAALIAASRIMDARHHPFDVITGSMLGILTAWGAYRQYFPPVTETWRKGRAYPIRSWGKEPEPPGPEAYPITHLQEGAEPLRNEATELKTIDEEADAGGPGDTNVFRQQISSSQRRRAAQDAYSASGPTPTSTYSADPLHRQPSGLSYTPSSNFTSNNPYGGAYRRRGANDDYASSSSEDEPNDFELQHSTSAAGGGGVVAPFPQYPRGTYNPVVDTFDASDTAYHRPPGQLQATTTGSSSGGVVGGDEADLGTVGASRINAPAPVPPRHLEGVPGFSR